MKKVYYLSTCSTCKRILGEVELTDEWALQDIKKENINTADLEKLKNIVGSYAELLNKRAQKYKALDLKNKNLNEFQIRDFILKEYTFLKRPVIIIGDEIFVGNSKKNVAAAKASIDSYLAV